MYFALCCMLLGILVVCPETGESYLTYLDWKRSSVWLESWEGLLARSTHVATSGNNVVSQDSLGKRIILPTIFWKKLNGKSFSGLQSPRWSFSIKLGMLLLGSNHFLSYLTVIQRYFRSSINCKWIVYKLYASSMTCTFRNYSGTKYSRAVDCISIESFYFS